MNEEAIDKLIEDRTWDQLESWSRDEHGNRIPNRGLCETQSTEGRPVYQTRPATPAEIKAAKG